MADPSTSPLLPKVDCKLFFGGFNPGYRRYNINDEVKLTIEITRDNKTHQLPIHEDHSVRVALWIECKGKYVAVSKPLEKPLKEYDGGREGKIKIPGFHPLPILNDSHAHHLVVEVTPKGYESFYQQTSRIDWDKDKVFPWVDREIKKTARDAYIANRTYLTNIVNLIRGSRSFAHHFNFHAAKYKEFWASMIMLKQNVDDTLVEIDKLQNSTVKIEYSNVPEGKPVRPVQRSFLVTEAIFKTETESPPARFRIGYKFPVCVSIDFDRPHPKGSMCKVFVYLSYKPEKDATCDARNRERDEVVCEYEMGEHYIWFSDHNRRKGLVRSDDLNWVELIEQKRKLQSGRYFLDIAVQSDDWTEQVTYTSKTFTMYIPPGSGEGQSST